MKHWLIILVIALGIIGWAYWDMTRPVTPVEPPQTAEKAPTSEGTTTDIYQVLPNETPVKIWPCPKNGCASE